MAITFRANKGSELTFAEMDTNFGSLFYSSSVSPSGRTLYLHYTSSAAVPVNNAAHAVNLSAGSGINEGSDRRIAFYTGSDAISTSEGIVIDSAGNVGIGINESTDLPGPLSHKLAVSGSIAATGGTVESISDIRFKTEINTINDGLQRVLDSRGVSYIRGGKNEVGVIAQEIQETIPEVVSKDNKGYLYVSYGNITGVLIEAIKGLNDKIEQLQSELNSLKG
jgi:hypothetical protein